MRENCVILEWSIYKLLQIRILYKAVYGRLSRGRHSCPEGPTWVQSGSGVTLEGWLYLGVMGAHPHTVNSSQPFQGARQDPLV
jgi:hypothetical protein